jgi:RNA polymerase sigma factor (sigma-70 family)
MTTRGWTGPGAFDQLFEQHHRRIWRFLARLGGRGCADDLAGEVFLRAFEHRERFDATKASEETWLYAIALNLLRDRWRRDALAPRTAAYAVAAASPDASPVDAVDDALASAQRLAQVRQAVARLPEHDREVLVLFAWEGLSYDAIAAVLGVEVGTVRSRLSRARARLRELVGPSDVVQGAPLVKETTDG